jgi:hypothetical protein
MSSRLSDDDRKRVLAEYNCLIKKGTDKELAAKTVKYHPRTLRKWNLKYNKRRNSQVHKRNRKSAISHVEAALLRFLVKERKRVGCNPKNSVLIEKAKDMCEDFRSKAPPLQQNIIKSFKSRMKCRMKYKLPQPRRKAAVMALIKNKVSTCKGVADFCLSPCRRKDNCPYKRMIAKHFKKTKSRVIKNKGEGLFIREDCRKNDFIMEYIGKRVDPNNQQDRNYYMKVGKLTINGNIEENMARYINHSFDPNCVLNVIQDDCEKLHACFFALKKIKCGSELTFNYNWELKNDQEATVYYCNSKKCTGTIEKLAKTKDETGWIVRVSCCLLMWT